MNLFSGVACVCLTWGMVFPVFLAAQGIESSAPSASSDLALPLRAKPVPIRAVPAPPPLSPQQEVGQGLFLQNCALCHLPQKKNVKSTVEEGTTVGPLLKNLFRRDNPPHEESVWEFIRRGTQKMPGFQYGLERKEIDSIIAYLKTL